MEQNIQPPDSWNEQQRPEALRMRPLRQLSDADMMEAVAEGVDRAITRMIRGITDMPSFDFWQTLEKALREGIFEATSQHLERIEHGQE